MDRREKSDVAFQIGLDVRREEPVAVGPVHGDLGIEPREESAKAVRCRDGLPAQFGARERVQAIDRRPAGQRLAKSGHEGKDLGASQQETPIRAAVGIHRYLDVWQQFRQMLDFIDDQPWRPRQEGPRILPRGLPGQRIIKCHILCVREEVLQQGGFPRLSGTGHDDNRKLTCGGADLLLDFANDIHAFHGAYLTTEEYAISTKNN